MKTTGHHQEPRSSSSCAACKLLKRRCTPSCIFAPYFRADEPKKFAKVHKVFGASNVSKILHEVPEHQREDTVTSLTFEAEARLRDPVYGCIGPISVLQRRMIELERDLVLARARLARYAAFHHAGGGSTVAHHHHQPLGGGQESNFSTAAGNNNNNGVIIMNDHNIIDHLPIQCNNNNNGFDSSQLSLNDAFIDQDFGQVPLPPL